jgi:2-polyprenyl-3-methyl-5-hydroxy-6-metoxy-1,4-benzoquinol methylase
MSERITPDTFEWDLLYVEHAQRYEFFTPFCKGRSVLDAACGAGFGSELLFRGGAASVLGVDLSQEAVDFASHRYSGSKGIRFLAGDCEALETLNEKFDVVISFETIEHLKHPERLVEGARKVLNPNGLFICSTPNILRHSLAPGNTFVNQYHLSEMHYADFEALLGKFFRIHSRFYQDESGAYIRHRALAHLVLAMQNSKLLRLETALRKCFGKAPPPPGDPLRDIQRSVPGDYVIAPLDTAPAQPKTYILVAEAV